MAQQTESATLRVKHVDGETESWTWSEFAEEHENGFPDVSEISVLYNGTYVNIWEDDDDIEDFYVEYDGTNQLLNDVYSAATTSSVSMWLYIVESDEEIWCTFPA